MDYDNLRELIKRRREAGTFGADTATEPALPGKEG